MFDRIVRCSNCGGIVEFEESLATYYSDEEITVCCAGGCPDCKRTYFYDEVYKFSHVANIEEVENYNV